MIESNERTPLLSKDGEVVDGRPRANTQLHRTIDLPNAISIGIGIMLGSGIFVSPGGVMQNAGSFGLSIFIWIACGILSLLGGLCYAELGTSIPESGGDYAYISKLYPDWVGFLRLWVELIIIRPGCHAAIAITFAIHVLQPVFMYCEGFMPPLSKKFIAAASILLFTWLNMVSVKWSCRVNLYSGYAKVLSLVFIIALGIVMAIVGDRKNFEYDNFIAGTETDVCKLSLAAYAGLWSFAGWTDINLITEELINPKRNLPLAIIFSTGGIVILYVLVNLAYFTVLTPSQSMQVATAQLFSDAIIPRAPFIIPIFVALACFGGINGSLFASGRLFYVAGKKKHLPPLLSMVSINSLTPSPAVFLNGALSVLMVINDDIYSLINYTNFIYFVCIILALAGLIKMKLKGETSGATIHVPLSLIFLTIILMGAIVIAAAIITPWETLVAVVVTLSGLPIYFILVRPVGPCKRLQPTIHRLFDKCSKILQKILLVIPEEKSE